MQQGVVGGEVVPVVDAREVVHVGVCEEGVRVQGVHAGVEEEEGRQRG